MAPLRNRITGHCKVRAGDLVPHEANPRVHPDRQRRILAALYDEIGFARSLLAFRLPDGRLKLIDGHLRADLTPDEAVDVEVLDVTEGEAKKLLLAIDPLAELAACDAAVLEDLRRAAEADSAALRELRRALDREEAALAGSLGEVGGGGPPAARYLVLVELQSEDDQVALWDELTGRGFACRLKTA